MKRNYEMANDDYAYVSKIICDYLQRLLQQIDDEKMNDYLYVHVVSQNSVVCPCNCILCIQFLDGTQLIETILTFCSNAKLSRSFYQNTHQIKRTCTQFLAEIINKYSYQLWVSPISKQLLLTLENKNYIYDYRS